MAIDWTHLVKKYKGPWVGLKNDQKTVVASGKTVREVVAKAQKSGYENPILFRVPDKIIPYMGSL